MKLREYKNEEINKVYEIVKNMKDWSKVACSGLYQRSERNKLMVDMIKFYDHNMDQFSKNSILNSIEAGEKPNLLSMNGCHESFYMYELNGVKFFTNTNLN
jgi:hypothetical protein